MYLVSKSLFLVVLGLMLGLQNSAQAQSKGNITGRVVDESAKEPLIGVNILLRRQNDTSVQVGGTSTDFDGNFKFDQIAADTYLLRISYVGYENVIVNNLILQADASYPLDTVRMKEASALFGDIVVEAMAVRVEMVGDTVQYNASAFKVNPDATVEDLIKKMPGITVENGVVKAQGQDVKKVTIDGKEFFGDDATTAVKNLPANIVDKIQVYDRASDQAALTGISDGQEVRAINIKTRGGNLKGKFGRFYAGYGTNNRYNAGGNFNSFEGDRRISILGMSNNINIQNFGGEDLMGVLSTQSGGGRGGGSWRGNNNESFSTGQQNGISNTHAFGINYNDKLGKNKKLSIGASYFFNYTLNKNLTTLNRNFLSQADNGLSQLYNETTNATNNNLSHRTTLRLEYKPDTLNTFIFNPRISWQGNKSTNNFVGLSQFSDFSFLNSTNTENTNNGNAYNIAGNATYSHRFAANARRNLTIDLTGTYNNRLNDNQQLAQNFYAENIDSAIILNQLAKNANVSANAAADINWSEPIGKNSTLEFSLNEAFTQTIANKTTNDFDSVAADYSRLDTNLSNNLNSLYLTHRPGVRYRFGARESKVSAMLGVLYQYATLTGTQDFPTNFDISRSFHNLLPIAMFRYQWSKTTSMRLFYRTSTNSPNANQLQNVIDNSNTLFLSAGNPNLVQSYSHFVFARFNWINPKTANSLFANISVNYTNNYIGNSTLVAQADTLLASNVILYKGAQLSQNVNLNGYNNVNANLTYSMPITKIKCNLTFSTGAMLTQLPSLINNQLNKTNNLNTNGSIFLSSNINENIDFNIGYTASYNMARNQLRPELNTNFINHNTSLRFNWLFGKGFVLSTNLTHLAYTGLADGFNQNFLLLNGSFGYKFLKNKQAEVNISVFDALKQNQSISRTVSDIYIQDQSTQVLTRYFMLNFVYNLRSTKQGGKPDGDRPQGERPQGDRPQGGGMPPHGGGGMPPR
jgi:hypothetical protein